MSQLAIYVANHLAGTRILLTTSQPDGRPSRERLHDLRTRAEAQQRQLEGIHAAGASEVLADAS